VKHREDGHHHGIGAWKTIHGCRSSTKNPRTIIGEDLTQYGADVRCAVVNAFMHSAARRVLVCESERLAPLRVTRTCRRNSSKVKFLALAGGVSLFSDASDAVCVDVRAWAAPFSMAIFARVFRCRHAGHRIGVVADNAS
jgi:hypothetical protein